MITKDQALGAGRGSTFYHVTLRNRDGSALRCRVNGRCKVWKTRPAEFSLPVVHGFRRDYFYINHRNAHEWLPNDPTEAQAVTGEIPELPGLAAMTAALGDTADFFLLGQIGDLLEDNVAVVGASVVAAYRRLVALRRYPLHIGQLPSLGWYWRVGCSCASADPLVQSRPVACAGANLNEMEVALGGRIKHAHAHSHWLPSEWAAGVARAGRLPMKPSEYIEDPDAGILYAAGGWLGMFAGPWQAIKAAAAGLVRPE